MAEFENFSLFLRSGEPLPAGRMTVNHSRAVHRHLFGDVYAWAGRFRRVRIAKGAAAFCYPEHIEANMAGLFSRFRQADRLRGLSVAAFAEQAAAFLGELNAIHPFRKGNGRTQMTFMNLIAAHAGHPIALSRLEPVAFLEAMIRSFRGDEAPLAAQLRGLMEP